MELLEENTIPVSLTYAKISYIGDEKHERKRKH